MRRGSRHELDRLLLGLRAARALWAENHPERDEAQRRNVIRSRFIDARHTYRLSAKKSAALCAVKVRHPTVEGAQAHADELNASKSGFWAPYPCAGHFHVGRPGSRRAG